MPIRDIRILQSTFFKAFKALRGAEKTRRLETVGRIDSSKWGLFQKDEKNVTLSPSKNRQGEEFDSFDIDGFVAERIANSNQNGCFFPSLFHPLEL